MARDNRPFVNGRRSARYQSMHGEVRGTQYRALCADGTVRTAIATAEPNTFFTVPCRVTVSGRTVAGHVYAGQFHLFDSGVQVPDGTVYQFSPSAYRRNADALPAWPARELRP